MKTCFVSMPFGRKTIPESGKPIDFDRIYNEFVKPAIDYTDCISYRMDDVSNSLNIHKSIIELVINSDIMIADLTTNSPNVMYELGIRHMAQRGLTIMICYSGSQIPFGLSSFRVISYELNSDGSVNDKSKLSFIQLMQYSIESDLEQIVTDSPIYQFFPDINISLPDEFIKSESKSRILNKESKRKSQRLSGLIRKADSIENLNEIRSIALNEPDDVDPVEFVNLLKKYRDMSAWDDLVLLVEIIPDNLKKNPDVQRLYALSLNRLGRQEQAIIIVENLISQTGGDTESYGILGRIYKEKYESSIALNNPINAKVYLDKAIEYYKLGLEKQPDDIYTGVNFVTLLFLSKDEAASEVLKKTLPSIRNSLQNSMANSYPDYWDYATAIELSCIANDWIGARKLVDTALDLSTYKWMVDTTVRNLKKFMPALNEYDKSKLNEIISLLQQNGNMPKEGLGYAKF